MASRYYGLNAGQTLKDIVEGSSTGSKSVELVVSDTVWASPQIVLELLEQIKQYVMDSKFPPA